MSLNPFEIRGGLKPHKPRPKKPKNVGLNPFEIRGGLKPLSAMNYHSAKGLNPFEIRGGLKLAGAKRVSVIEMS